MKEILLEIWIGPKAKAGGTKEQNQIINLRGNTHEKDPAGILSRPQSEWTVGGAKQRSDFIRQEDNMKRILFKP